MSKKVARLSVTRHRLKRQVVAALKSLSNGLPAALIVFPRVSAVDMDFKDIKAELVTLLSKIRK
ncbi:hypothetical protein A3G63_02635 [Candidatus Kaiserbacteria bacterium RIFCSPLOWO2_12_FULL_52_8]|uniref:Uncharacterized protein n=1 Tax=Candidatus Kaiserbacteria bacterium RIFCSPHIGHO2_01_FULL_53_31 TaxID=1798481 RepID=A0A1F6CGQ9_9BACT|nr:MAG: hypothetical protein A2678_02985 [Candidatus Kaiserbacteria bacterium RIFCSPHIGHO2_01_FULL_53_31]OGG92571.1 MAG: hypothetical protein A3G63_02635 [Candidatus Kaiserbacteria bacterium RIFCSPLOWO2_12_FULL_52_8]